MDASMKEGVKGRPDYIQEVPNDHGQVRQQVSELREIMDMLYRDHHILAEQLKPVMAEEYPKPMDGDVAERVVMVPVADDIFHINQMFRQLHIKFSDLCDRISI